MAVNEIITFRHTGTFLRCTVVKNALVCLSTVLDPKSVSTIVDPLGC